MNVFDLHLREGDRSSALGAPGKILLSVTQAKKYFGNENPLGKRLTIHDRGNVLPVQVTGVFQDLPVNSNRRCRRRGVC